MNLLKTLAGFFTSRTSAQITLGAIEPVVAPTAPAHTAAPAQPTHPWPSHRGPVKAAAPVEMPTIEQFVAGMVERDAARDAAKAAAQAPSKKVVAEIPVTDDRDGMTSRQLLARDFAAQFASGEKHSVVKPAVIARAVGDTDQMTARELYRRDFNAQFAKHGSA